MALHCWTVSETVSKNSEGVVKNSRELGQIVIENPIKAAI
jgi:hypothetical protein